MCVRIKLPPGTEEQCSSPSPRPSRARCRPRVEEARASFGFPRPRQARLPLLAGISFGAVFVAEVRETGATPHVLDTGYGHRRLVGLREPLIHHDGTLFGLPLRQDALRPRLIVPAQRVQGKDRGAGSAQVCGRCGKRPVRWQPER